MDDLIDLLQQAAQVDTKEEAKALNERSIHLLREIGALSPETENLLISWGNQRIDEMIQVNEKGHDALNSARWLIVLGIFYGIRWLYKNRYNRY